MCVCVCVCVCVCLCVRFRMYACLMFKRILRSAAVTYWTAKRRPGVQFLVGTVYLSSFTSFAGNSKWGCRL